MRRISASDETRPAAYACIMTLPMAVASAGPATTGMPVESAVNWFRSAFFDPPPMTWSFSMGKGASARKSSSTMRYLRARLSKIARTVSPWVRGGVCPVRVQNAAIAAGMQPGRANDSSSGSIKIRKGGAECAISTSSE